MRLTYAKLGRHFFEITFELRQDDFTNFIPFRLWKDGKSFEIEAEINATSKICDPILDLLTIKYKLILNAQQVSF